MLKIILHVGNKELYLKVLDNKAALETQTVLYYKLTKTQNTKKIQTFTIYFKFKAILLAKEISIILFGHLTTVYLI